MLLYFIFKFKDSFLHVTPFCLLFLQLWSHFFQRQIQVFNLLLGFFLESPVLIFYLKERWQLEITSQVKCLLFDPEAKCEQLRTDRNPAKHNTRSGTTARFPRDMSEHKPAQSLTEITLVYYWTEPDYLWSIWGTFSLFSGFGIKCAFDEWSTCSPTTKKNTVLMTEKKRLARWLRR